MAELSREEKISFILKNERDITLAVLGGHMPHDKDEYQETRLLLKQYRQELFGDILKNKNYRSVKQIF